MRPLTPDLCCGRSCAGDPMLKRKPLTPSTDHLDEHLVKRAFAMTLRLLRDHTGHSQHSLAHETDMDLSFIQSLEYGESAPTVVSVFRLGGGLQVTPASMAAMTELYIRTIEASTLSTPSPPEAGQLLALLQHQPSGADADTRTISQALGIVVRRLRSQSRCNQHTLAVHAAMDASYLGMIERGQSSPTLRIARRLGDALHVDAPSMIEGADVLVRSELRQAALERWLESQLEWRVLINGEPDFGKVFATDRSKALQAALQRTRYPDAGALDVCKKMA